MEKLKLETKNLAKEKFNKLIELFPNALTETIVGQDENGNDIIERAINADILRQEISENVLEGREERYEFTWPDKRKSILLANAPINKTLRPVREDSLNFDTTENLYIEGDNLEVLKLIRETYLGKIKMIYIDPPYNTGNDFLYEDDFAQTMEEYKEISGDYDDEGNRLFKNTDSNGKFHTDWLNMMYPRLKLARDFLSDDGVIFISIDDNEVHNLKKTCDEIFGEGNFIAYLLRKIKAGAGHDSQFYAIEHDYVAAYAKNIASLKINHVILDVKDDPKYRYEDKYLKRRGRYYLRDLQYGGSRNTPSIWKIKCPDGTLMASDANGKSGHEWRWGEEKFKWGLKNDFIVFKQQNDLSWRVYIKQYQFVDNMDKLRLRTVPYNSYIGEYLNNQGTAEINELFEERIFSYPKPSTLIKHLLKGGTSKNSIILDFFSGSATTAHAVMELNAEDGGNRKYIMVQLPEETEENSEAYKAGYKNICEIGKERIRRAGKKIKEENPDSKFDDGFRVLKVDSSNMKDIFYSPEKYNQSFLDKLESNVKEDRSEEDLLFQVMLDLGIDLSSQIKVEKINGNKVLIVEDGFLISCFDRKISEKTIENIAQKEPYYAVFTEGKMSDSTLANFEQIFETYSPSTIRKVI